MPLSILSLRFIACLAVAAAPPVAVAATPIRGPIAIASVQSLKKLSLEELLALEVTTVSRRAERSADSPSAISVFTSESVRRYGATTIADVLRLPTGLHVARQNGNTWAIASRGFNLTSSNKLLVMLDGRSLYTPLFSGVLWDAQDTMLEDIERIEVVRGPGATMWGANAVNGVVNIITKPARDTVGTLVTAGAGNEETLFGTVRHGFQIGDGLHGRVYAKTFRRDGLAFADGSDARDDWKRWQAGFRVDSMIENQPSTWTVQGDLYRGFQGQPDRPDVRVRGGNILGRWTQALSPDRSLRVQAYFDHVFRFVPLQFEERRDTIDLDVQFNSAWDNHHLVAGVGARTSSDDTGTFGTVRFMPASRRMNVFNGFVQNEFSFLARRLGVTVGAKFEDNSSSGFEIQPSLRAAWKPTETQTWWTAVSRAVRTPTRFDDDIRVGPTPTITTLRGDPGFQAETLIAYEIGYRTQPRSSWAFEVSLFFNDYDRLRSIEAEPPPGSPLVIRNKLNAETYGGEVTVFAQLADRWRIRASYSRLHKSLVLDADSTDPFGGTVEGNDPKNLATLSSRFDLTDRWELDATVRHVGRLPSPAVPSYTALDLRLGWHPNEALELSLVGHNLLDRQHREFGAPPTAREVQRSIYGKATWRF